MTLNVLTSGNSTESLGNDSYVENTTFIVHEQKIQAIGDEDELKEPDDYAAEPTSTDSDDSDDGTFDGSDWPIYGY